MSLALSTAATPEIDHVDSAAVAGARRGMTTDTIASGLSFMLVTNILQRGIGFLRNIAFCLFLTQQDLGYWALASGFLILAAPLSVLGLPGSIARFAELYRTRNQLAAYIGWMVTGSSIGVLLFAAVMICTPSWSSALIFGESLSLATVMILTATLVLVVAFNFLTELLGGLRQNRVVSKMQMVNSLSFTAMSVTWLLVFSDWRGVLVSFAIASLLGTIPGLLELRTTCKSAFVEQSPMQARNMWMRVIPFAASIWLMNLMSNLFDIVDRYMLLHLASTDAMSGTAVVGQFHSGRMLPVLITSLAMMLNGMILPHMSADWEAGAFEAVKNHLRTTFKLMVLFFWALSIGGMIIAPYLFHSLLTGRYQDGLSIMPLALVHCTYAALAACLHNYLWCEEKGGVITRLLVAGLLLNIALNFLMVPAWCVYGAMLATFIAGVAILIMTILILSRHGCWVGYPAIMLGVLPCSLAISTTLSMFLFTLTILVVSRSDMLLDASEKQSLNGHINPILQRLGLSNSSSCFWR